MSGMIRVLPPELVERIAAGEVIERPASVVKELVENALDAGARRVTVEVSEGGIGLIRVSDDGRGVGWEEGNLLFHRHATSKLASEDDLGTLATMGFRGEALASMGAVADVEFESRRPEEDWGFRLRMVGGERELRERTARPAGTTVTVRRLFFNTPARKKFLRGPREELLEAVRVVTRYAQAFPGVAFRLVRDDREILQVAAEEEIRSRWRDMLGGEEADALRDVEWAEEGIRVRGAVSVPEKTRGTASEMLVFVNGRLVLDRALNGAILASYRGLLPARRFPRTILLVEMPPHQLDVNVHPAKKEVRFAHPDRVREAVRHAVSRALMRYLDPSSRGSLLVRETAVAPGAGARGELAFAREPGSGIAPTGTALGMPGGERPTRAGGELPLQLDGTFILHVDEQGVRLIDQHTAHERILFEEALRRLEAKKGEAQELLIPTVLTLSPEEELAWEALSDSLTALGFTVNAFGPRTIAVAAYPSCLGRWDGGVMLREILAASRGSAPASARPEALAAGFACRGAVKAGQPLSRPEMQHLLDELHRTSEPQLCPHGRPTMITVTMSELRRRFRRE